MQLNVWLDQQKVASSTDNELDNDYSWSKIQHLVAAIPAPNNELLPGVKWGDYRQLYTPAYWKVQYHLANFTDQNDHCLGENLNEEIVACLLGGYGIPSEVGLLAFRRLRDSGLIKADSEREEIFIALSTPFELGNGRKVRYRFYSQKAKYIAKFLQRKDLNDIPYQDDYELRNWLMSIDGIGPKTASWITRNWLQSDNVAIIDIHILRAGIIAGFFSRTSDVSNEYFELENRYIRFCSALQVRPSNLDALIWENMKVSNRIALQVLSDGAI
jgi:thermostable 8-oxoguanine DNA glycosylase